MSTRPRSSKRGDRIAQRLKHVNARLQSVGLAAESTLSRALRQLRAWKRHPITPAAVVDAGASQ